MDEYVLTEAQAVATETAIINGVRWIPARAVDMREGLRLLMLQVHDNATAKGFWDDDMHGHDIGHQAALITSEISEFYEAWRNGNPQSEKIPEHSAMEEELADVLIRVLDCAQGHGLDLVGALEAKMQYNAGRPARHGGKRS